MAGMLRTHRWKSAAVALIAVIALGIGINAIIRKTYVDCIGECVLGETSPNLQSVIGEGTYEFNGNIVNVTMHAPLVRGALYGLLSGACEGTITGITRGDGRISATVSGVCRRFLVNIPLEGTVDGAISIENKTIMLAFEAEYGGFGIRDKITLVYR